MIYAELRHNRAARAVCAAVIVLLSGAYGPALAQSTMPESQPSASAPTSGAAPGASASPRQDGRAELLPPELQGVGITEHLDAQLPLDAIFTTHDRRQVTLGDYFDGKRPVILVLNYYKCPMLCGLLLNGLTDALKQLDWTAGEQFQIVTISFNPFEGPELANLKRTNYLEEYGRPAAGAGWEFMVGRKEPIQRLLDTTGFSIKRDDATGQYYHASTLILCTPDGRISRYLRGVTFEPRTLRLSLVEASQGKIGTTTDQLLLFCYHYEGGQYTLAAMNIVRAAGLLTLVILAIVVLVLWRRETHRGRAAEAKKEPGA
jgi:protein SCO1